MSLYLNACKALDIVLGKADQPSGSKAAEYKDRQGIAAAMINASCHYSVRSHIDGIIDPYEMWKVLKARLDTTNTRAGRTAILQRFSRLRPGSGTNSLNEFISSLLDCRKELAGSTQSISDETFISQLIISLPDKYNGIIDIITHQASENQTVDNVIATLLEWDSAARNRQAEAVGAGINTSSTSSHALEARTNPRMRNFRTHKPYQRPSSTECWYCGMRGHRQDVCRIKKRGEAARNRHNGGQISASNTTSDTSGDRNPNTAVDDDGDIQASYTTVQALVTLDGVSTTSKWIIDSGVSHHLSCNSRDFQTLKRLNTTHNVYLGDGTYIPALGIGLIRFQFGLNKSDVIDLEALYVPQLRSCLLSVSKLSERYRITFNGAECLISNRSPSSTKVLLLGRIREGLYHLQANIIPSRFHHKIQAVSNISMNNQITVNVTSLPSLNLWHLRLAHLGIDAVKHLIGEAGYSDSDGKHNQIGLCDVCLKAKQQRIIERKPATRTKQPFELIHSDLCRPMTTPSISAIKYFILYIDDYSRVPWVYFLRSKTAVDIVSVFQEFKARVEKQFPEWPITRFRCDNGKGEYDNSLFRGILRVSGITFEPSPPYAQHKNGVSERMIRTIVTKARALIIDSHLSDNFWAEAVNTAVYLHIRSPSRSVNGKTPYEILYKKLPTVLHLRRFGCAAYKLIPQAQRSGKFTPRSRECIMIGYVNHTTTI